MRSALVQEMKFYLEKLRQKTKAEDPRLSFSTPEFKEASRIFTEAYKARRAPAARLARAVRPPEGWRTRKVISRSTFHSACRTTSASPSSSRS